MLITFGQNEIIAALHTYINNQGIETKGKKVTIKLTLQQKDKTIYASVNIEDSIKDCPPGSMLDTVVDTVKEVTEEIKTKTNAMFS